MVLSPVSFPDAPVESVLAHLKGVRKSLHGWVACCPAHHDRNPVSVSAWATKDRSCSPVSRAALLSRLWKRWASPWPTCFPRLPLHLSHSQSRHSTTSSPSLILHRRAAALEVPPAPGGHRATSGMSPDPLSPGRWHTAPRAPLRTALVAKEGSHWSKGPGEIVPYGLERLEEARKAGYLVLVEGESDCWTLWYHHFPALGLPGARDGPRSKKPISAGIDRLYIVQEPDAAGARFVSHLTKRLQGVAMAGQSVRGFALPVPKIPMNS